MQQATTNDVHDLNEPFRIYIRREGGHFVGMCAELRAIIDGSTVEEIVSKTKTLIARAATNGTDGARARITILVADNNRESRPSANRLESAS